MTKVYTSTAPPLLPSVAVNRKRPASGKRILPKKKRKVLKKPIKKRTLQIKSKKRKAVLIKKRSSKRKPIKKTKSEKKPRKQPVYDSSDEEDDDMIIGPKTRIEMQHEDPVSYSEEGEDEEITSEGEEADDVDPEEEAINNMTFEEALYKRPSIPSKYRL